MWKTEVSGLCKLLNITMSTIVNVRLNVLMYINTGKEFFSENQPYSSHVRIILKPLENLHLLHYQRSQEARMKDRGRWGESDTGHDKAMEHISGMTRRLFGHMFGVLR